MGVIVQDMHDQEAEVAQEKKEASEGPKKVGFDVGSSEDSDEEAETLLPPTFPALHARLLMPI